MAKRKSKIKIKVVPKINRADWRYSKDKKRLHKLANEAERKKYGKVTRLNYIPDNELGGDWKINKGKGTIYLSKKLKKKDIPATKLHERTELVHKMREKAIGKR